MGAEIDATDKGGRTALHLVLWAGNVALATLRLQNEANLNQKTQKQSTVLIIL
jgi:ankyrin repeat protein